jgi:alpha-tubulin suppressor-like RCC1 family protein
MNVRSTTLTCFSLLVAACVPSGGEGASAPKGDDATKGAAATCAAVAGPEAHLTSCEAFDPRQCGPGQVPLDASGAPACCGCVDVDAAGGASGAGASGRAGGPGGNADPGGEGCAANGGHGGSAGAGGSGGAKPAVRQIASGGAHNCALFEDGSLQCWGLSLTGALGNGYTPDSDLTPDTEDTPVAVLGVGGRGPLTGVRTVALGGQHSCALTDGGGVLCWGDNAHGQLGDGTREGRSVPAVVLRAAGGAPLAGVRALALGRNHTCAVTDGGAAWCWGGNERGQLGDGTTQDRPAPVPVLSAPGGAPLAGVKAVSLGTDASCAVLEGGEVRCWGFNDVGQLGDGTTDNRSTPVAVRSAPDGAPFGGVASVALGDDHACAVRADGGVYCWGGNGAGQLGDGTKQSRATPAPVLSAPGGAPLAGARAVGGGSLFSCALAGEGEVLCWGYNRHGQLGDGTFDEGRLTPAAVLTAPGGAPLVARDVDHGHAMSCALVGGRDVRCWGINAYGQLGDGTFETRATPVPVAPGAVP